MTPLRVSSSSSLPGAGLLALLLLAACATSPTPAPSPSAQAQPPACETARACLASCEAGSARACSLAADRLRQGLGVARDVNFARRLYRRACEARDGLGCAGLASLAPAAEVGPSFSRALPLLEASCASGDAESCISEGTLRLEGKGAPADATTAEARLRLGVERLAEACRGGSGPACARVAALLDTGPAPVRDTSRALSFHQQACDAGVSGNCAALALRYLAGRDVAPDKPRMLALFQRVGDLLRQSCEAGSVEACAELGREQAFLGPGVPNDAALTRSYREKACELGDLASCLRSVEALLLAGRNGGLDEERVSRLKAQARTLREEHCRSGSGTACLALALEASPEQARVLRQRACELGHSEVCVVAQ